LRYKDGRVSSQGQQVTAYPHDDVNNVFVIEPADPELFTRIKKHVPSDLEKKRNVRYLINHDVVRLRHFVTDTYLITHDVASPLTKTNMEITTLSPELADQRYEESLWEIVIAVNGGRKQAPNDTQVMSRKHNILIVNIRHNVALHGSKDVLPEWGFKQQEVNGNKKVVGASGNEWVIDTIQHERIVNGIYFLLIVGKDIDDAEKKEEKVEFKSKMSFLDKFSELQSLMLIHNSRLTKSHPYSSHAISWPIVVRGISYWEEKKGFRQIYVLGNPLIWWSVIVFLFANIIFFILDILSLRRGVDVIGWGFRSWWYRGCGFLVMAWGLHWIPFFIMGRQLFLHHYFPAFIFSVLAVSAFLDLVLRVTRLPSPGSPSAFWHWNQNRWGGKLLWSIVTVLVTMYTISFYYFLPLTYGTGFPNPDEIVKRKWLSSWDLQYAKKE
jgi:dolichyl-phosphate-mannose-protein mannosyltransferase